MYIIDIQSSVLCMLYNDIKIIQAYICSSFCLCLQTNARMATVKRFPGEQYISEEGALRLIQRGTFPASVTDVSEESYYAEPSESEAVRFRHDPKLILPSYTYSSHNQV